MKRFISLHWRTTIWVCGVASVAFSVYMSLSVSIGNKQLLAKVSSESRKRQDQTCSVFERAFAVDVEQLSGTYKYILQLTPEEKKNTLNRVIISQLPAIEARTHEDRAPAFCDKPGVGLPEPNPVIPKRPPGLK